MVAAKPESLEFAEQLMWLSGGLAAANGLFAWLTTGATVNLLLVELGIGALWLGMTVAIRTGRLVASIGATALALISVPVIGIMAILASLYAGNVPGVIVMFVDMIRLPIALVVAVLLWTPGSRQYLRHVREVRTSAAMDAGTKSLRDFASCGWRGGFRFGGGS